MCWGFTRLDDILREPVRTTQSNEAPANDRTCSFLDGDMFMRYLWGLGIGHLYTRSNISGTRDRASHQPAQRNDDSDADHEVSVEELGPIPSGSEVLLGTSAIDVSGCHSIPEDADGTPPQLAERNDDADREIGVAELGAISSGSETPAVGIDDCHAIPGDAEDALEMSLEDRESEDWIVNSDEDDPDGSSDEDSLQDNFEE